MLLQNSVTTHKPIGREEDTEPSLLRYTILGWQVNQADNRFYLVLGVRRKSKAEGWDKIGIVYGLEANI